MITRKSDDYFMLRCIRVEIDHIPKRSINLYSFLRIVFLIASILPLMVACDGEGLQTGLKLAWDANPETAVNSAGGGYRVYYSSNSGFNPVDGGVTEVNVPYTSGATAPTTVVIPLGSGTYFVRLAAYSALNAPGTTGVSISTATPQISLTVPVSVP